jgi:hypothetical protein
MGNLRKNEREERIASKGERKKRKKKRMKGKRTVSYPDSDILLNPDPDPSCC